ncbi:methylenetetrahydrofolate reductase [Nigerium massiliense]|uniref:methylenetetrahydrofolate reductase n=1 Tax=Nigerium massiliense TaxID=1522317 RepID=UPI00058CF248|nr:methylenetetrahydrofolate reductase [Nigerium massiliense]
MPANDATIPHALTTGGSPTFSFEYFPPKDAVGVDKLREAVSNLSRLCPSWVSVTYGATGATRERTFEATRVIRSATPVTTMGHLTVAGQSVDEVRAAIESYAGLGLTHILALRGDPAGGPTAPFEAHPHGLSNATELVRLIKQTGDFRVGVAAFPDIHPDKGDRDLDVQILLDKQEAGAEFAITQLFFRAENYFDLVERFRARGGTMPIVAGIMPVTNVGQIERFRDMSGVAMPDEFSRPLLQRADDPASFRALGIEQMTRLCDDVLAGGAPGLQFFTLNRSTATSEILAKLREMPPRRS